jgi:hypothetical protein
MAKHRHRERRRRIDPGTRGTRALGRLARAGRGEPALPTGPFITPEDVKRLRERAESGQDAAQARVFADSRAIARELREKAERDASEDL